MNKYRIDENGELHTLTYEEDEVEKVNEVTLEKHEFLDILEDFYDNHGGWWIMLLIALLFFLLSVYYG